MFLDLIFINPDNIIMKKTTIPPISAQRQMYHATVRTLIPDGKKSSLTKSYNETLALKKFLFDQIKDMYWVEKHLLKILPRLKKVATSEEVRDAFSAHFDTTEVHVDRLEVVFELLEEKVQGKKCEALEGIMKEVEHMIGETREGSLTRDAALIAAAQKIEHYEIASYTSMVYLSRILGEEEVATVLQETLEEEKKADLDFSMLSVIRVNSRALRESVSLAEEDYEDEE